MIYAVVNTKGGVGKTTTGTTTCLAGKALLSEGKTLSEGFVHTVVDAAAITDLLEVIDMAKDYNSELQVWIFLARIDSRTKDAAEMLAFLHEQKLPVLSSRACERVAYRRAIGEGAIVQELGKDPSSSQEMEAFLAEVTA